MKKVDDMQTPVPYLWPFDGRIKASATVLVVVGARRLHIDCPQPRRTGLCISEELVPEARRAGLPVVYIDPIPQVRGTAVQTSTDSVIGTFWDKETYLDLLVPRAEDTVLEVSTLDGFYASGLDTILHRRQISHLIFCGFGLETCIHSTLRSANDRGYECLLLSDACAAIDLSLEQGALKTVTMSGGIFGAVADSRWLIAALGDVKEN